MNQQIYITDHACRRYIERILLKSDSTQDDIKQARKSIKWLIRTKKKKTLAKDIDIVYWLIAGIVFVVEEDKTIITLYPATEETLFRIDILKSEKYNKFRTLRVKGYYDKENKSYIKPHYVMPELISISKSKTKQIIHLTINDSERPFNLSGCFSTEEKALKFIANYTDFTINIRSLNP